MTTKTECLKIAAERKAKLAKAIQGHATFVVIFGGSDVVAVQAGQNVERLSNKAHEWTRIANLQPKTRAVELKRMAGL